MFYRMNERGAIMKPVILAEKPSQAKAYADAFSVRRHEGYLELLPSLYFQKVHTLHGESAILSN